MIQTIAVLWMLAGLDTMFSGICAASGRNALINKHAYYARSMVYGFAWGQAACLLSLLILTGTVYLANDRDLAIAELVSVGDRMATVYWAYAAIVMLTFAVRAIPSVDIRSVTSVMGFGPLTVARPFVIVAGLSWGLLSQPSLAVAIAAILIALMMIPFRIWLNWMLDLHGIAILRPHPRG